MNTLLKSVASKLLFENLGHNFEQALDNIIRQAKVVLNADSICLLTISPRLDNLVVLKCVCQNEQLKESLLPVLCRLGLTPNFLAAAKNNEILFFSNAKKEVLVAQVNLSEVPEGALVYAPVYIEQYFIGWTVAFWSSSRKAFSPEEKKLLSLLTNQIGMAFQNARLTNSLTQQLSRLSALLELSTTIYSSLNYKIVLEKVIYYAKKLVGADGCTIYLLDKMGGFLKPLMTNYDEYKTEIMKFSLKIGEGFTGKVAASGQGMLANQAEQDPRTVQVPGTPNFPESIISVPLLWSEEVIGVITINGKGHKRFKEEDLNLLTIFARLAADAIENARLFENLENAYKELNETQEIMVQNERLRALGEMAGGVAHDFNNILGAILGRAQLLLKEQLDEKVKKGLKIIEKSALDGAETVRRIQEFTRLTKLPAVSSVNINRIVEEAIEITKPKWKAGAQKQGLNITLEKSLGQVPATVGIDTELKEVVASMISNAVDAMPNGGQINISTWSDNSLAYIQIKDTGTGMSEETKRKIFEPFFTTKGPHSTGLGLSLAYGIVARHKGEIQVDSEVNCGATFTVKLPLSEERIKEEEPSVPKQIERELKILAVDDDENILSILQDILTLEGHKVTGTTSGKEALNILDKEKFNLLITDLGMPEISGWDLARESKKKEPTMPVILISGWGAQLEEQRIKQSGVDVMLPKPFHVEQIKEVIARALQKTLKIA